MRRGDGAPLCWTATRWTGSLPAMKLTEVTLTSWAASSEDNEDSTAIAPLVAVVVDGAGLPPSLRSGCSHSVAWYSRTLAKTFRRQLLDTRPTMRDALRTAIASVAAEHEDTCDLAAGSPSATVAAWRVVGASLQYLVLCDSSILLAFADGERLEVTDDRLSRVVEPRVEANLSQRSREGLSLSPHDVLRARRDAVEALRNTPGGFWCCHHDPAAADEALEDTVPLAALRGVVLATDGATRGLQVLGTHTLEELIETALSGRHDELLRQIRAAEEDQQESLTMRAVKVHDDATVVSARIR
jgi:hypothetical protein